MCVGIRVYIRYIQLFYIQPVISSAVISVERQSPPVCSYQHLLLSTLWVLCPDPDEESVICHFCFY